MKIDGGINSASTEMFHISSRLPFRIFQFPLCRRTLIGAQFLRRRVDDAVNANGFSKHKANEKGRIMTRISLRQSSFLEKIFTDGNHCRLASILQIRSSEAFTMVKGRMIKIEKM